jgi:hypothetical protein
MILQVSGQVQLDPTAVNNLLDMESANYVYATCEELNIPVWTFGRDGVQHAKVSLRLFVDMKETGNMLGKYVYYKLRASIEQLWRQVGSKTPEGRRGLPPRCNKAWFAGTFCNSDGSELAEGQDVWEHCRHVMMYDGICFVVGVDPGLGSHFVEYRNDEGQGLSTEDLVDNQHSGNVHIGCSAQTHGIKNSVKFRYIRVRVTGLRSAELADAPAADLKHMAGRVRVLRHGSEMQLPVSVMPQSWPKHNIARKKERPLSRNRSFRVKTSASPRLDEPISPKTEPEPESPSWKPVGQERDSPRPNLEAVKPVAVKPVAAEDLEDVLTAGADAAPDLASRNSPMQRSISPAISRVDGQQALLIQPGAGWDTHWLEIDLGQLVDPIAGLRWETPASGEPLIAAGDSGLDPGRDPVAWEVWGCTETGYLTRLITQPINGAGVHPCVPLQRGATIDTLLPTLAREFERETMKIMLKVPGQRGGGQEHGVTRSHAADAVLGVSLSLDGKWFAFGGNAMVTTVGRIGCGDGRHVSFKLDKNPAQVAAVRLSADGRRVIVGDYASRVSVFPVSDEVRSQLDDDDDDADHDNDNDHDDSSDDTWVLDGQDNGDGAAAEKCGRVPPPEEGSTRGSAGATRKKARAGSEHFVENFDVGGLINTQPSWTSSVVGPAQRPIFCMELSADDSVLAVGGSGKQVGDGLLAYYTGFSLNLCFVRYKFLTYVLISATRRRTKPHPAV